MHAAGPVPLHGAEVKDRIAYSTDPSFCLACQSSPCVCADPAQLKRRQQEPLRLSFVRLGKGSGVTRIERLNMEPLLKQEMFAALKKRLGCGGALKNGVLEFQGDHRDGLESHLKGEGYKIKRVGG
jgi:translation initiation factor 1